LWIKYEVAELLHLKARWRLLNLVTEMFFWTSCFHTKVRILSGKCLGFGTTFLRSLCEYRHVMSRKSRLVFIIIKNKQASKQYKHKATQFIRD
jgi:hypothetical protein